VLDLLFPDRVWYLYCPPKGGKKFFAAQPVVVRDTTCDWSRRV